MHLRPRQKKAVEALYQSYIDYKRPAIICATGGFGKSVVQAKFAELLGDNVRILQVADRKELLDQNERKYHQSCDVGVVSTGLERMEFDHQIVIGGIQTIYNKTHLLGRRDIIIIDECDLYDGKSGMYHELIKAYPNAKLFGLTGSPWRSNEGKLTWGDIIFNVTYKEELDDGYLSPITSKIAFKPELAEIGIVAGDYNQKDIKTKYLEKNNIGKWVEQLVYLGKERKKWLVFLPDVESANNFAFALSAHRILARAITAETKERDTYIEEFRKGELQCLVGVGVFERGFDVPDVDLIADFFPTKSLKKWLQRIWRGVRIAEGKKDCLYLDYAGNLKEFGSIHNQEWLLENGEVKIKKKYNEKICPNCESYTPAFKPKCVHCDYEFIVEKQQKSVYDRPDVLTDINEVKENKNIKWYSVSDVEYEPNYTSSKGNKMLKVTYFVGSQYKIYQYVFNNKRASFVYARGHKGAVVDWKNLKKPKMIKVNLSGKFPEIIDYKW